MHHLVPASSEHVSTTHKLHASATLLVATIMTVSRSQQSLIEAQTSLIIYPCKLARNTKQGRDDTTIAAGNIQLGLHFGQRLRSSTRLNFSYQLSYHITKVETQARPHSYGFIFRYTLNSPLTITCIAGCSDYEATCGDGQQVSSTTTSPASATTTTVVSNARMCFDGCGFSGGASCQCDSSCSSHNDCKSGGNRIRIAWEAFQLRRRVNRVCLKCHTPTSQFFTCHVTQAARIMRRFARCRRSPQLHPRQQHRCPRLPFPVRTLARRLNVTRGALPRASKRVSQ